MIKTVEDVAVVNNKPVKVWAEIMPATPLLIIPKPEGQKLRYWIRGGRSWREPHIRWWVEVISELDGGSHHIEHDTGGVTLRHALWRAAEAIDEVIDELELSQQNVSGSDTTTEVQKNAKRKAKVL